MKMALLPPQSVVASPISTDGTQKTTVIKEKTTSVVNSMSSLSYKPNKILLNTVNPYITCNLCKGYLIDATTIVECLHSFCHSCLMKHLRTEQYCPQCEMMINKAKPNIKPDATLQAIVYKLVPGLYESELLRKREFYSERPKEALRASPEQRGDDTEHLIFSPNEKISLSLEYADKDIEYTEELDKPKYLLCPAIFTIANLKKFIIYKFGIAANLFHVEIMYKVKTIVLPDHYTLMDVAYIYTWKRDAPMRYFYRIRTKDTKAEEVPDFPVRRSPSLSTRPSLPVITEEGNTENDSANANVDKVKSDIGGTIVKEEKIEVTDNNDAVQSNGISSCDNVVKMNIKDNKDNSASEIKPKTESIKIKIEMLKNRYVSTLQTPDTDGCNNGEPIIVKKSKKSKKSDTSDKEKDKDKSKKNKSSSDLKIKIEKVKETSKNGKKSPYTFEISGNKSIELNDSGKKSSKNGKSPKRVESIRIQSPLVLKIDQNSSGLSPSYTISSSPLACSSPVPSADSSSDSDMEEKKSKFLNSFELTSVKSLSPHKLANTSGGTPPSIPKVSLKLTNGVDNVKTGSSKRKTKEPTKNLAKKPKASNEEIRAMVEKTVKEKISNTGLVSKAGIAFDLSPIPIGKKQENKKVPSITPSAVVNGNEKASDKLDVYEFKAPAASTRPSQADTPRPNSCKTPSRSSVPSFAKPMAPPPIMGKKLLNILPKGTITTSPNKETEINKIKPEDMNKNVKVYGPPSTTGEKDKDNFAVPSLFPTPPTKPKPKPSMSYLNYALLNTNKAPAGSRTPIPSYSYNSPSYSPDSPQYNPNHHISTKGHKYTNPLAYANFMRNMLHERNNKSDKPKFSNGEGKKRPCPSPEKALEPPEKQQKVQALLNQINIPSSLSITITNEQEEANANTKRTNSQTAANNYIEILKLPEISITEAEKKSPVPLDKIKKEPVSPKSDSKKSSADKKQQLIDSKRETFQEQFLQSILEKEKYKDKKSTSSTKPKEMNGKNVNDNSINKSIETVKSNPELDLIKKVNPNKTATPTASKNLPILPKPSQINGVRKSLSPPNILPKPSGSLTPKSKTPPVNQNSLRATSFLNAMAKKATEPKGKKNNNTTPKPSNSYRSPTQSQNVLDLSREPTSPFSEQAAALALLKNGLENNQMAYLSEIARLSRQHPAGLAVPPMVQQGFNPYNANQMMQAYFIQQQLSRMQKAGSDALENYVQSLQNNNQTSPKNS